MHQSLSWRRDVKLPAHHPDDRASQFRVRLSHAAHEGDLAKFTDLLQAWQEHSRRTGTDLKQALLAVCVDQSRNPADRPKMLDRLIECAKRNAVRLDLDHQVFNVVYSGEPDKLAVLLKHGVKLQDPGERKTPLLHLAVQKGRAEMVRYLLSKGMDIETRDKQGRTPMFEAVIHPGRAKLQRLLVQKGANLHVLDNEGRNLLHLAIRSGHYKSDETGRGLTIARLLDWGVDPQQKACHGLSPLEMSDTCTPQVRAMLQSHALQGASISPAARRRTPRL